MKHLFVVNPIADKVRGRVKNVSQELESFCQTNLPGGYYIHITRWSRDAVGFIRRYASGAHEIVRIHVLGGSGTLYEAVNGVIGLPNVQIAAYPMGRSNYFLRYFGDDKLHLFTSLRSQIFSQVTSIDAIRCGNTYGISHGLVGMEAISGSQGRDMIEKTRLPTDFCYQWAVGKNLLLNRYAAQNYQIELDGQNLNGRYLTMMIANGPCYGKNMSPAVEAHPNDGQLDFYFIKDMPIIKRMSTISRYASGNYQKVPEAIFHQVGQKITISSDRAMCLSVDGETFYGDAIEYELIPYAIDFVCPPGVNLDKIPRVRNKPEEVADDEK